MDERELRLCLDMRSVSYPTRRARDLPRASIRVGPVYHAFKVGSLFSMTLTPSMAARGMNVVFDAANPAETRKGLSASTIPSYRSWSQLT